MLKPVNNHLLIEPVKYDSFISQEKGTYQEIGIVIDIDPQLPMNWSPTEPLKAILRVKKGDKVYFDSWLAGKFPTGKGDEYFWLVKWEDVKAVDAE